MDKPVELFDALDVHGNKLDIDMIRGEPHEDGLYHAVVEIYTINQDLQILLTKRDARKPWPLYWEITGGSVLKGETILAGAIRELHEETGIHAHASELVPFYQIVQGDSIFYSYLLHKTIQPEEIKLQENETIDYQFIPVDELEAFMKQSDFVNTITKRFTLHRDRFDSFVQSLQPQN